MKLELPVESLLDSTFAPFGRVIRAADAEAGADCPTMVDLDFSVDGTAALYVIRYPRAAMDVVCLERHLTMTESRIALGGTSVFVAVMPDDTGAPDLATAKSFLIPPHHGVVLNRGVWHGLQAFPVAVDNVSFAFITEREAESELADGTPNSGGRSQIIDLEDHSATRLIVTDPNGLLTDGALGPGEAER